ncbi:hypothetical protein [Hymenobacter jeollabukensis]|uniref:Uncharacterized protein n=1 Tax=Hymenobacter jeollabukensis TaxID=2025313 RepID=A0A5R8WL58_9BACT|nr:hypothetical protein [Hymenobacter jeollabukensis]TLM89818.1 hypothetical protein FDY95_19625 [Hymenobacter jeollabukensis]
MLEPVSFLYSFKQHHTLPIRLIAPGFGHLPAEVVAQYGLTHRKSHYFLFFMLEGRAHHGVDLQQFNIARTNCC